MEYNVSAIDGKWQEYWREKEVYKASNDSDRPKFYVLDMFPYPSGAGLHVGHPLGYIASDIYSRFKRHKGFNVLHPMGYDAFGLPAEQYAIQTGQHPAITTESNIKRYREQLDRIGFSFDWSREIRTCEPEYYRWTQWIFGQLFDAWYDKDANKARPISELIAAFETDGNRGIHAACSEEIQFSSSDWNSANEEQKSAWLLNYRLAYRSESMVNWCPALGTVLANDEVKDGLSERGGHPVIQKKMMQWSMRISAYAQRLLDGLNEIDWSESIKESQRNWIGRSEGARVFFNLKDHEGQIEVFTTRPDTIFGVSFMVLAPEHELVDKITTAEQKQAIEAYKEAASRRSERDRMADTKTISGAFTGAYAVHPFTHQPIPVWIGDYVLANYGTGAVMAVPGHDSRDYGFAKHFALPIVEVVSGGNIEVESYDAKEGTLVNSDFLNGLDVKAAQKAIIAEIEKRGLGQGKINYRLRDAIFGRQRYWGEPIPVAYENGIPKLLSPSELPLNLPKVDKYLPTEDGEPPLARAESWETAEGFPIETTTMPGWAGSSWYWLRYMDPTNEKEFAAKSALDYWNSVDLYVGGSEHATGHLLYSRFWNKFLFDLGYIQADEPFKKLINQGMIQGISAFVYRIVGTNKFVSAELKGEYETTALHADVSLVNLKDELDMEGFKNWLPEYKNAEFITANGIYKVGREVEKMSKSKYNVVNPDEIIAEYGADVMRLYEMFLGPIEQSKPWDTKGISGVVSFMRKVWRLYTGEHGISAEKATPQELKTLHKTIKKVTEDIENFSFNTSVSAFMICLNELQEQGCNKREILEPLAVLLAPFAPHTAEELWAILGHQPSITQVEYPVHNEEYLVENTVNYPIQFNGKTRFNIEVDKALNPKEVEAVVLADEKTTKYLEDKTVRKVIVVPGRIVNIVVG